MADMITPATKTTGTDINLNLNFDDIQIPEVAATTPNLNIDFSDVQKAKETKPEVKTQNIASVETFHETSPIVEETKPITEVNPASAVVESIVAETKIEDQKSSDIVGTNPQTSSAKDDRLAKEDAIVEKKEETPIVVEKASETPETTADRMAANFPMTSLKEDQKIIEELMSTNNTTNDETNQNLAPLRKGLQSSIAGEAELVAKQGDLGTETVTPPIVENHELLPTTLEPKNSGMDLDSLLGTLNTPVTNEVVAAPIINQPAVETAPQTMPGSTFQGGLTPMANPIVTPVMQMATTAPVITNNTNSSYPVMPKRKSKKLTTFLIVLVLGGVSAYVLKTMYPIETNNLMTNVLGTENTANTGGIENMLEATGSIGDTVGLLTGELNGQETGGSDGTTGLLSTSGFNGFADLEDILTGANGNSVLTNQQLTQLQNFSDEAKTFLELGDKINDKIMIKYGAYVSKKADGLIQSIENNEQIDNAKIDGYLAQFSGYLHQLTTLSYNGLTNPTEPAVIPQEANASTSGTNDTTQSMIQDINRENSGTTTETPTLPSGATQVPTIPGL